MPFIEKVKCDFLLVFNNFAIDMDIKPNVNDAIKHLLNERLLELEADFNADVLNYNGMIIDGIEAELTSIIEDLSADKDKREKMIIILTTGGGSATAVERYVNIIRNHYDEVDFIVPDYAYSAGTIFCMSGDSVHMDYLSVLGPIDPQVQNRDGKWVAALGYLDKFNEIIEKSKDGTITQAEFLIIKDMDLAELHSYEQAKNLTIDLLKKWLVNYKFKNWNTHKNGAQVTLKEKQDRAEEIAASLNNTSKWKSHGRPINIEALTELKLKIDDYTGNKNRRELIRDYYRLQVDYMRSNQMPIFVQTKKYI